ncbi:MAG: hypothetical protein AAB337_03305 [Patescibacteria group bacterium]
MRLCVRAQDLAWFSFAFVDEHGVVHKTIRKDGPPEAIFRSLVSALGRWQINWDALTSVAVVSGPGSYTAMRNSITITNIIAFVRNIPVASVTAPPEASDEAVFLKLARAKARQGNWSVPAYGAPPKITKSKK